jgi:hypothetical protein
VTFLLETQSQNDKYKVLIKFNEVASLEIKNIGGKYNQLMGFEIIKNKSWEPNRRFHVNDYENSMINFFCMSIEVLNIEGIQ